MAYENNVKAQKTMILLFLTKLEVIDNRQSMLLLSCLLWEVIFIVLYYIIIFIELYL